MAFMVVEGRDYPLDAWQMLVFSEEDRDSAPALIDHEPAPTRLGPATLLLALQFAGEEEYGGLTERAKSATALASRLVEQHAAAVLTPRLLELIQSDTEHYAWHTAVSKDSCALLVGAIAGGLGQPVLDVKDKDGRKA